MTYLNCLKKKQEMTKEKDLIRKNEVSAQIRLGIRSTSS